tara:strand:- start:764 stop:1363 length:600 start_codon:yes stop_codon:yes gene_type:complete
VRSPDVWIQAPIKPSTRLIFIRKENDMYEDIRARLLERVEEGAINKDDLILAMAKYLSTNQIVEMLHMNNMTEIVTPPVILRNFYFDSGHGWLEVTYEELIDLGITKRITNWSYRDGEKVYLEEDIDTGTYIDAVKEQRKRVVTVKNLNVADNHLRNPEDRVDPRKLERFYLDYDEVMPLGDAENLVGWVDKYKSGENK